ncbi:head GIN domain-containing protein [Flavobacterium sinopsychrotolerans]|uniref:Putative auto-transporter adhesin, head GIN domain n=1 Tax=Flavobacterium sinopsychrotolerans TaxID=604089 RepID=A0A1H8JNN4_9FLAO|nr:head GIN domain-containing protein [Flavobacterium sinopsychrotolerans]SEN82165.1 Putative auto-transporter adhesin, head GIN domain [Flavobacterium sinopsychrotolerans]
MKSKIHEYQKRNIRNRSKKLVIIAFVFLSQFTNAQVTRNLGDFDEVKVFDKINVKLIEASENKIVVTGARADEVETVNKNGELKIRMPFPQLLSGEDIMVKLYFKNLESIAVSEGSYVSSEEDFKQTSLDLNAKSGGEIKLGINVDKINVKANAGGIITLSGKSKNQDVVITSGGILNAKDLETSQTTISVAAGGKSEIHATTLVDAKVRAGGSIFIYGKPKQINKEVFIGGTILEKN